MRATVVIPARDRARDVVRAVRSLRTGVVARGDVEVVVVDDGSDPPLSDPLEGLVDGRAVRLVRLEPTRGRGAARNAGVERARGKLIIFMDSDMTAHPAFVDAHLDAREDGDRVARVGHILWTGGTALHRYLEGRGVKKLREGDAVPWRYFDSGNASVRRADFERVGGFPEEIPVWGGEDTLMGFDLERSGVTLAYCRAAVTCHHSRVDVERLCRARYTFGREALPVMLAARPGVAAGMRVDVLGAPGMAGGGRPVCAAKTLLVRLLLHVPGRGVVTTLLRLGGERLSNIGFDYLVYSSILRGYRDFLRQGGDAGTPGAAGRPSAGPGSEGS